MEKYIKFEQILQKQAYELETTDKPIVLFGASPMMGNIAKVVLDFLEINAVCFCDNDKLKQDTEFNNLLVLSPEKARERYPDAIIYLCLFNDENISKVRMQLENLGFKYIYNRDVFQYIYQTRIMQRYLKSSEVANTIEILNK